MASPPELVRVGRVVKAHGIRGEVAVAPEGETLALLSLPTTVLVGETHAEHVLMGVREHGGRLLVRLEGVGDRGAAEALRGAWLRVAAERLPPPAEGTAYVDELVGCRLEDEHGEPVGTVRGVVHGAAHDLLVVSTGPGEVLVPMVRDWLVELDPRGQRIRMRLPAGLVAG